MARRIESMGRATIRPVSERERFSSIERPPTPTVIDEGRSKGPFYAMCCRCSAVGPMRMAKVYRCSRCGCTKHERVNEEQLQALMAMEE